nr:hypothetical protein [uncultured Desulfobulbus sp.]
MTTFSIKGVKKLETLLKSIPRKAERAAVVALTKTGKSIKEEVQRQTKTRFDNPTRFTINSVELTPATKAKPEARVGFKKPDRMEQHYLLPQVEGGQRKLKGFERGIGLGELVPAAGARLTQSGNISRTQIRKKTIEGYVVTRRKHGRLLPGVYKRFKKNQTNRKRKRVKSRRSMPRGLRPILLQGYQSKPVQPLLPFYEIASREFTKRFPEEFNKTFANYLKS